MENPGQKPNKIHPSCEANDGNHRFEYVDSTPERTTWVCLMCGKELVEFEDCGTGA